MTIPIKGGRPTLEQEHRDPEISAKARALRARGMGWEKIALVLRISRRSAIRLVRGERNRGCKTPLDGSGTGASPAAPAGSSAEESAVREA